jgi:hypothetical protein
MASYTGNEAVEETKATSLAILSLKKQLSFGQEDRKTDTLLVKVIMTIMTILFYVNLKVFL